MNWSISFEPLLSWTLTAIVLVPVLAFAVLGLVTRQRGAIFRFAAFAALALALVNPVLLDEEREPLTSVVGLIVDRSQSQDIGNRTDMTTAAVEEMKAKIARFRQFEVRVVETGEANAADERTSTRLFGALDSLFRDVPPSRIAGAVMITDGQVHDIPETAAGFTAPLHALVTGEEEERDRRIRFERAPRFGIVDKPLDMTYRVLATGDEQGTVDVRISVNGEQVSVDRAVIGEETPLEIVIPNAGRNIVELSIDRVDGELTDTNNRAIAVLDGIRENLRVLLVSGEPHAGERTWRNLLKSDASVDLVHFTILRPPEKQDGTPINELSLIAFPTRELFVEKIDDFDLIIFDRYQHRDVLPILYYDYIAEYVEKGGALLIAAGPEYATDRSIARTPLMSALPALPTGNVVEEGFYPRLTETGERHPVTRGLEGSTQEPPRWSRWFRQIDVVNPQGQVVMKGAGDRPLLLLERNGEGRVARLDHIGSQSGRTVGSGQSLLRRANRRRRSRRRRGWLGARHFGNWSRFRLSGAGHRRRFVMHWSDGGVFPHLAGHFQPLPGVEYLFAAELVELLQFFNTDIGLGGDGIQAVSSRHSVFHQFSGRRMVHHQSAIPAIGRPHRAGGHWSGHSTSPPSPGSSNANTVPR